MNMLSYIKNKKVEVIDIMETFKVILKNTTMSKWYWFKQNLHGISKHYLNKFTMNKVNIYDNNN